MINIDYNSIEVSKNGVLTGKISINSGENSYPEIDWNDLIIIILSQWIGEILEVKNEMIFYFYDGNFSFKLERSNDHCFCNYTLQQKNSDTLSKEISYSEFIIDLKYHSNKILREYQHISDNEDYQKLVDINSKLIGLNHVTK